MKTNIIASVGVSVLVVIALAVAGFLKIPLVAALADATSSPPISTDSTSSPPSTDSTTTLPAPQASTSAPVEDTASSTPTSIPANNSASTTVATSSSSTSAATKEPPPQGLTLVHTIGTKYTDYFIDGTTTVAFPGDPNIDSHFNVPDAPIPTHEGLTWDHTTGDNLYDTPSGNIEVGDYAVQADGSYIANAPPFVSSTSTTPTLGSSNTSATTSSTTTSPAVLPASTSTVPASQPASTTRQIRAHLQLQPRPMMHPLPHQVRPVLQSGLHRKVLRAQRQPPDQVRLPYDPRPISGTEKQ